MIVSASRRTDIPALYGRWLQARLEAGFAEVVNPFDPSRSRRVDLVPAPEGSLRALVLWTRNPAPLLEAVPAWEERGLRTLWLVTVTAYPRSLEPAGPSPDASVEALRRLSRIVGPERVTWRYDPVFLCPGLGLDRRWHAANFERLAVPLAGSVGRCIVSHYDDYAKTRRRLLRAGIDPSIAPAQGLDAAGELARVAAAAGLPLQTCCEGWQHVGIPSGACIDGLLLDRLWDLGLGSRRDPGQRPGCRCAPSVDIGAYDTCTHGCLYCYATGSAGRAQERRSAHNPGGERLV